MDSTLQSNPGQASSPQMGSENVSQPKKKKINLIISVVVLLLLIVAVGYYLWPEQQSESEISDLLEFTVMNDDLSSDLRERYLNQFNLSKQAIEKDPNYFDAWLQIGRIKKDIGDYRGAEAVWLKLGEMSPKNSTSFANLADLYANFIKDHDKAQQSYRVAIKNSLGESRNIIFYRNFHEFYLYSLENKSLAEQILLEGIENNSGSSDLVTLLAVFYRDEGNTVKAIQYFERSLELDPEDELIKKELQKLK